MPGKTKAEPPQDPPVALLRLCVRTETRTQTHTQPRADRGAVCNSRVTGKDQAPSRRWDTCVAERASAERHPTKAHRPGSAAPRYDLKWEAQPPESQPLPRETAIVAAGCRARAF